MEGASGQPKPLRTLCPTSRHPGMKTKTPPARMPPSRTLCWDPFPGGTTPLQNVGDAIFVPASWSHGVLNVRRPFRRDLTRN